MARAEPAIVLAAWFAICRPHWDTAQMRTNANNDQPIRILNTIRVCFRINQRADINSFGFFNFFFGSMADEHRLTAPYNLNGGAYINLAQINLNDGFMLLMIGQAKDAAPTAPTPMAR